MDDGSSSGKPKKRYRVDTRVGHFRWRCVCGDEVCKELTSTLNEEGNIRGGSLTIPTKNADILVPLWERHLKLDLSANVSHNANKRSFKFISRVHFKADNFYATKNGSVKFKTYFREGFIGEDRRLHIRKDGLKCTVIVPDFPRSALKVELAEKKSRKIGSDGFDVKRDRRDSTISLFKLSQTSLHDLIFDSRSAEKKLTETNKNLACKLEEVEERNKAMKTKIDEQAEIIKHNAYENNLLNKRINELRKRVKATRKGLHIENLVNDDWHEKHRWAATAYFGFPNWQLTKILLDCLIEPENYMSSDLLKNSCIQQLSTTLEAIRVCRRKFLREVLIALLKMRRNYSMKELCTITDYGINKIRKVLKKYIPLLGRMGRLLCNFRLEPEFIKSNQVKEFKDSPLASVAVIGDGKDIHSYEVRAHSAIRRAMHSNKEHCACHRGLSFSTSNGLYCIVSSLFLARATEQKLFGLLAPWFDFLSPDLDILYDKGLRNSSHLLPNLNKIHTPSFLGTERKQYGDKELSQNRKIARLRYTIEVGYSRIENWRLIKDRASYFDLRYLCDVWYFAHCMSNLMMPLR